MLVKNILDSLRTEFELPSEFIEAMKQIDGIKAIDHTSFEMKFGGYKFEIDFYGIAENSPLDVDIELMANDSNDEDSNSIMYSVVAHSDMEASTLISMIIGQMKEMTKSHFERAGVPDHVIQDAVDNIIRFGDYYFLDEIEVEAKENDLQTQAN